MSDCEEVEKKMSSLSKWIDLLLKLSALAGVMISSSYGTMIFLDAKLNDKIDGKIEYSLIEFAKQRDAANEASIKEILKKLDNIDTALQANIDRDETRLQLLLEKQVEKIRKKEYDDIKNGDLEEVVTYYPSVRDKSIQDEVLFNLVSDFYKERLKKQILDGDK